MPLKDTPKETQEPPKFSQVQDVEGAKGAVKATHQTVVTTTTTAKVKGNILLQTVRAEAFNQETNKSKSVQILLDSGSQRTYITDSLKSRLGLKPTSF